jgi:indole-3-glycerol phosphate synthase
MSGATSRFLDDMAAASAARSAAARALESFAAVDRRARATPAAPPLVLSAAGFDVIAELKLRSPAAGQLRDSGEDWRARVSGYAQGGAAAVSVLTEPTRFDGSLAHLTEAAALIAPYGVPAMRKDFLVDPYQVLEARAAGAGGVLLIARMLPPAQLGELLDCAAEQALFVLLEAFDVADLEVCRQLLATRHQRAAPVLVGINCRDLQTLQVVPARFGELAPYLPAGFAAVAESGVADAADARRMRAQGYGLALIGTALMARDDPRALLREILGAARTLQP